MFMTCVIVPLDGGEWTFQYHLHVLTTLLNRDGPRYKGK